jgi:hypothetical protein
VGGTVGRSALAGVEVLSAAVGSGADVGASVAGGVAVAA